jgi:hypothetical protein
MPIPKRNPVQLSMNAQSVAGRPIAQKNTGRKIQNIKNIVSVYGKLTKMSTI